MSHPSHTDDTKIINAERILKRTFNDQLELRRALSGDKSLALLGDSILRLLLIKEGIRRHATRGSISTVLSQKASNPYLVQQGFSTGLAKCMYINPAQGDTISPGPLADTVEAVIAAVFIDSAEDMQVIEAVMQTLGICWP